MISESYKAVFIMVLTVYLTGEITCTYLRLISINLNVLNFKPLSFMDVELGISPW
jgi:hypothetical protein